MLAVMLICCKNRSTDVIRVLERTFYRFRGVITKASAAFWADDGRESFRFNRREGVNNDIFDPVSMATRTAAIPVPIAGSREWFVWQWFQRLVVHRATPRII